MKELSIEEKAKRYDEALKRAKGILEFYKHPAYSEVYAYAKEDIPGIFPELAENEDKDGKIRKNCIHFLELQKSHHAATFEIEECIDWLEKQKEPEDKGEISDGYHTFNELYRYRMLYNAALFNLLPKDIVHKSKRHHDGKECFGGGWFIVMANLPTGQISNHYELKDWDLFQIPEKEVADEWDGHTPQEAAERLHEYLLQKQGKQTEINLVEILKHFPRETELYSPLYGKLWLAEVDEENEIITCYRYRLDEGCTRATLEQENTISFYSNGTTGLPDFSVSKDCMLFLHDVEKQGLQNLANSAKTCKEDEEIWSEKDEKILNTIINDIQERHPKAMWRINDGSTVAVSTQHIIDWLKSLKERFGCEVNCTTKKELKPIDEQKPAGSDEDEEYEEYADFGIY